jgi:ribose transport system substrate-binding protein
MKRFLALLLFAAACLSFASCSFSPKTYTVNLIVKGTGTEFWKSVNRGAQAAASMYHANVQMYGPEEENFDQSPYIEQAISRKPDAIILAASDYNLMAKQVDHAVDSGIPVVMVDSDVNSSRTAAYVGTDNVALGSRLAKELCKQMKVGGKVGVVSFVQNSYPAVQREKGFRDTIAQDGRFKLLNTRYCDSDIKTAEEQTSALLKSDPDLVAIAALNDPSATGAAQALSKSGRKDLHLFAVDCLPEEAMYMEEGVLDLALLQNPYQMGYYSVETAVQKLNGQSVKDIYTDIYAVNKNTMFDELYQQLIFPFSS